MQWRDPKQKKAPQGTDREAVLLLHSSFFFFAAAAAAAFFLQVHLLGLFSGSEILYKQGVLLKVHSHSVLSILVLFNSRKTKLVI
jgi:hypothetical protein